MNQPQSTQGEVLPDLDGLWNYGDPAATEAAFRAVLPAAEAAAAADERTGLPYLATLWSQIARTFGLRRDFEHAHVLLDRAAGCLEGLAEASREVALARAWIAIERGRTLNSGGDPAASVALFQQAREAAERAGDEGLVVDALHMLAIADEGRDLAWNEEALAVARVSEAPRARRWLGSLLNNQGWSYHERGEHERALALFEEALALREAQGNQAQVRIMRWCVARAWRSLGRLDEALAAQRSLAAERAAEGEGSGYAEEEIGECLLALGRGTEAEPHFASAHAQLSQDAWLVAEEPERLARLARLGAVTQEG
jgi:tetratricopeptide (TPR) repeat protein